MESENPTNSSWINSVGEAWNRFWYSPSETFPLAMIRILAGISALYFLLSHTPDLIRWFGTDGLMPIETAHEINKALDGGDTDLPPMRPSYLYLFENTGLLWTTHVLAILSIAALTIGAFTRFTTVLSFVFVLSYINRAPMLTGSFEPVLSVLLFYLCFAPCGRVISFDRWRQKRREAASKKETVVAPSIVATICIRLIQIHVSLFYLFMGLSKFTSDTWRDGGAVWWLLTRTESRLVDLTFLYRTPELVHLWSQGIVLFELLFAVLIWNRMARPLLLIVAIPMWISLALITGQVSFSLIMLIANLAYIRAASMRTGWNWFTSKLRLNLQVEPTGEPDPSAA